MHQIRQNARSTSARRVARSTIAIAIALLVDRRVRSSDDRAARRSRYDCPTRDEHARWSTIAIVHRAARRRGAARSGLSLSDLGSLSLSLSLRKWFEVKMRGENDFQVKGENSGQPEVIFRKMIFSMNVKHSGFIKNDFRIQFSPNSNTHLVNADNQLHLSKEKPHQLQGVHCWSHTIFTWCFVQWRWTQYPWLKLKLKWGKLGWLTSHGQCQGQHSTVHAAVLNFCSPYTVLQTCGKC